MVEKGLDMGLAAGIPKLFRVAILAPHRISLGYKPRNTALLQDFRIPCQEILRLPAAYSRTSFSESKPRSALRVSTTRRALRSTES